METSEAILRLRRRLGLTQEAFAARALVTRQAVSRWEAGETIPSTDTLRRLTEEFDVPADYLLGRPAVCQSCGMALEQESDRGTEADGGKSEEYCASCYQCGGFTQDLSMEEQIEHNLRGLAAWNRANGTSLTPEEARAGLRAFLPTLKRWRDGRPER